MQIGSTSFKTSPKMDCFSAKYESFMVIFNWSIFYLPDCTALFIFLVKYLCIYLFIYLFFLVWLHFLSYMLKSYIVAKIIRIACFCWLLIFLRFVLQVLPQVILWRSLCRFVYMTSRELVRHSFPKKVFQIVSNRFL